MTFDGTSLVDVVSDRDEGLGGYCDIGAPVCELGEAACEIQIPQPPYWVYPDQVSFSIPDYTSSEGGVATKFKWKICVKDGACITDWLDYNGKDLIQSARIVDPYSKETGIIAQLVHVVDSELPGSVSLKNGVIYNVKVLVYNAAGLLNGVELTSRDVLADLVPPKLPEGKSVYNGEFQKNVAVQLSTNGMGVSWDAFEDAESGIDYYSYQIFEYGNNGTIEDSYVGSPVTRKTRVNSGDDRNVYATQLSLSPGKKYFARVTAVNGAGVQSWSDSAPVAVILPGEGIVVETTTEGVKVSSLVVVLAVVGSVLVLLFLITLFVIRKRYRNRREASRRRKGQLKNIRQLLNNMSDQVGNANVEEKPKLDELKYVAFVITDLENSTKIASSAPNVYDFVQEAHDTLMRDLIAAYGAYEINTEGDAFHVAFRDVGTAVQFCMEIQYEMMRIEWPKEVLRISGCEAVYSKSQNHFIYRGPRIRMGIHWADEGHVVQQVHSITKHRIFSGSAFQVTRELCEAAKGGQVLLTHAAWEKLRSDMSSAGFPVVEQLGSYAFETSQKPIWVYQIRSLLGKPLHRPIGNTATNLKNLRLLNEGAALSIASAPMPLTKKGNLAFVCIKLDRDCISATSNRNEVPSKVTELLQDTICACSMQYQGYLFRTTQNGYFYLAYHSAVDAVRMSHLIQVILMAVRWPSEFQDWYGKQESSADGKLLFKGPRISIGIHESSDYSIRPIPQTKVTPDGMSHMDYLGPAEEACRALSDCAHGGQVILSESAWSAVQHQLPAGPTVISLGTHAFKEPCFSEPILLMEVMPKLLSRRTFPRPKHTTMIDSGYRDAPAANSIVTIAHLKIVKPSIVIEAERHLQDEVVDASSKDVLHLFAQSVSIASKVIRKLLKEYGGYECKEPQPGKFTLAFADLEAAIRWAAAVQAALVGINWPEAILEWNECAPAFDIDDGDHSSDNGSYLSDSEVAIPKSESTQWHDGSIRVGTKQWAGKVVLWRGLPVRIGMASGVPLSKAPLNTGRADYYGTIPNLAARLVQIARPGQILFDAAKLDTLLNIKWSGGRAYLSGDNTFLKDQIGGGVYLTPIGQLKIKGLEDLRSVFQADSWVLQSREFEEIPCVVRSVVATSITRRMTSLRKASEASSGFHPAVVEKSSVSKPGIFASISRTRDSGFLKRMSMSFSVRSNSREVDSAENSMPFNASTSDGQPANISYSDTSSFGGTLLKQAVMFSTGYGKNSESSVATTPKSQMSHEHFHGLRSSPDRHRSAPAAKASQEGRNNNNDSLKRCEGPYGSLDDFAKWDGSDSLVRTPTAQSKVVDHWDAGFALEEALHANKHKSSIQHHAEKTVDALESEDGDPNSLSDQGHFYMTDKARSHSRMWYESKSLRKQTSLPTASSNDEAKKSGNIKNKIAEKFRRGQGDEKNDSMRIF